MPKLAASILDFGGKILDRFVRDPEEKAAANLALAQLAQSGDLKELEVSMSAILAEAESDDPWTSRWRPMFAYVFYIVILSLVVVAPLVGVFFPEHMKLFFANVALGFEAIPGEMWATFTAGSGGPAAASSASTRPNPYCGSRPEAPRSSAVSCNR